MKQYKHLLFILLLLLPCVTNAQTFGGMGATLKQDTAKDGYTMPLVEKVLDNSPAKKSGIQNGWYIIKVGDISCKNKPLQDIVNMIRGEVGTKVTLSMADNIKGKHAKDYEVERGLIKIAPPPDPVTAFYEKCAQETIQLKKQGHKIVKNANSECGDFYFSFEAAAHEYHAKVVLLRDAKPPAFLPSATLFDNNNEDKTNVPMKYTETEVFGRFKAVSMEGAIILQHNSVGVVKTNVTPDVGESDCKAMYVVVYR